MKKGDQVSDFELPDQTGTNRVGISTDALDKQARFADLQQFDYPLLSDGVRTTFVIDTDRTVLDVSASELSMDCDADKALEVLRSQ